MNVRRKRQVVPSSHIKRTGLWVFSCHKFRLSVKASIRGKKGFLDFAESGRLSKSCPKCVTSWMQDTILQIRGLD